MHFLWIMILSVPNFIANHPIAVEIFHSKTEDAILIVALEKSQGITRCHSDNNTKIKYCFKILDINLHTDPILQDLLKQINNNKSHITTSVSTV